MLDFRLLRHFCAIVAEGQISRAAQTLHISQPTLSLSLKELEEKLGLPLINRSGGKWQVTEHGQLFYQEARRLLAQLDELGEKMRNPYAGTDQIFGEVRLGCSGFCTSFVRSILPVIARDYPGIRIRLLLADNLALENFIQRQGLDLALIQLPMIFGNYDSVPLAAQHFVTCWSPLIPNPADADVNLEELAQYPLILARRWSNIGAYRPLIIAMQELALQPHVILDTPFAALIPDFLRTVPAVGVLPENELSGIANMDLQLREIANTRLQFRSAAIWHKDCELSAASEKVVELLSNA